MDNVLYFTPNKEMHKELGDALIKAKNNGVEILAYDSIVKIGSININEKIKVVL